MSERRLPHEPALHVGGGWGPKPFLQRHCASGHLTSRLITARPCLQTTAWPVRATGRCPPVATPSIGFATPPATAGSVQGGPKMAGAGSPAPNQPPDVEAGRSGVPGGPPEANGTVPRALETVGPPAAKGGAADAADSKSEYAGADEAHKVEHEREVLPEDEKTAKPVGYFSLYRWVPADEQLGCRKPQHGAPRHWAAPSCAVFHPQHPRSGLAPT